jgi:hypothetical protein
MKPHHLSTDCDNKRIILPAAVVADDRNFTIHFTVNLFGDRPVCCLIGHGLHAASCLYTKCMLSHSSLELMCIFLVREIIGSYVDYNVNASAISR